MARQRRFDWLSSRARFLRKRSSTRVGHGASQRPLRRALHCELLEDRRLLAVSFTGTYTQDFDSLPTSGTAIPWVNDSTLPGWSLFRQPAPGTAITSINASNGTSNSGVFSSFGVAGAGPVTDRALGGVGSSSTYFGSPAVGSVAGWIAVALTNTTGATIDALDVRFDGEQWRNGGSVSPDTMRLEYGFGSTFNAIPLWYDLGGSFTFESPETGTVAAALDGNATENRASLGGVLSTFNWTSGSTMWIRWVEVNDIGSDHALAIDNVSVTATSALTVTNLNNTGSGSLRDRLSAAAAATGSSTIVFAPFLTGGTIFLQSQITVSDAHPVIIAGPGPSQLAIDGLDGTRLLNVTSEASITNLTLSNGRAAGAAAEDKLGGAIRNRAALTIDNVTFASNVATSFGGAIDSLGGSLFVTESTFTENTAANHGGAISSSTVFTQVQRTSFLDNSAGGDGGAIHATESLYVSVSDFIENTATGSGGSINSLLGINDILGVTSSQFVDNVAQVSGGGVRLVNSGGTASIGNSTFEGNSANGAQGDGGGIHSTTIASSNGGSTYYSRLTITGNDASRYGGGVYLSNPTGGSSPSDTFLTDSLIDGNDATNGGGAFLDNRGANRIRVSNSTFTANTAVGAGGGLKSDNRTGTIFNTKIDHSTFAGNSAGYTGGGVAFFSGLGIINSIIAANVSPRGNDVDSEFSVPFPVLELYNSLIGNRAGSVQNVFHQFPEAPVGSPDSQGNLIGGPTHGVIDPKLAPLANNGGPTLTLALRPGSPAINAVNPAIQPPIVLDVPDYDQRGVGFDRIAHGRLDMGAFEYSTTVSANLVVDTLVDELDDNLGLGDLSLREAVFLANLEPDAQTVTFASTLVGQTLTLSMGVIPISDSVVIDGPGAGLMTLVARDPTPTQKNGDGSRIFGIGDNDPLTQLDVSISGLTLTGGDTGGNGASGGAIQNSENLTIEACVLTNNSARDQSGGAVHNGRGGTLTVIDSRLSNNSTTGDGGAIQALDDTFIIDSVVSDNFATLRGGAVSIQEGSLTVVRSTISDNTANQHGGGVFASTLATSVQIDSSTISGNFTTGDGGGARLEIGAGQSRIVTNSTISGNRANADAGGLQFLTAANTVRRVEHSTVTNNRSDADFNNSSGNTGGGVAGSGILGHVIVAGNFGPFPDLDGVFESHYSLVGEQTGSNLGATPPGVRDANGNFIGSSLSPVIPLLGSLSDNGGPTRTHLLLPGSPAINAGAPDFDPSAFTPPLVNDQRGAPYVRVFGGRVDIGAFEVQPPPVVPSADFDSDGDSDGADFLTWQRGVGRSSGASLNQGDSDSDGDVDSTDLANWKGQFGSTGGLVAAAAGESAAVSADTMPVAAIDSAAMPTLAMRNDSLLAAIGPHGLALTPFVSLTSAQRHTLRPTQQEDVFDQAIAARRVAFDELALQPSLNWRGRRERDLSAVDGSQLATVMGEDAVADLWDELAEYAL